MFGGFGWLAVAIVFEVLATSLLKISDGFTRPIPALIVIAAYAIAFYCLAAAIKTIPIGIAYALWCGIGIVMVTAIAWVAFGQKLDPWSVGGIALILAGAIIVSMKLSTAN